MTFMIVAALMLLAYTLFGCIAILGFGFDSAKEITLALCLLAPFPLYLVTLRSAKIGISLLWIYFVFQWLFCSFGLGATRALINPFGRYGGFDLGLLAAIAITQIAIWITPRASIQSQQNSINY